MKPLANGNELTLEKLNDSIKSSRQYSGEMGGKSTISAKSARAMAQTTKVRSKPRKSIIAKQEKMGSASR